jgi:hypothetical protein
MRSGIQTRSTVRVAALSLALLAAGACGKKTDQTATQTSGGAIAPATSLQVTDVTLGRSISGDKRVADQTDAFAARDTIYASIHTSGTTQNANVAARWMFQDGQVVSESTETISPTGDAYTEFHVFKPSGWPAGTYTVHVLLNGQDVQTKDFTVK